MINEEWKTIADFDNYEISTAERVRNKTTGKYLSNRVNKQGYKVLELSYNNNRKFKQIHRLIAEAFLDNPLNKIFVDHKDNNKLNNSIDNLRWCSKQENTQNRKKNSNNNGYKGVDYKNNQWRARIGFNGREYHLGLFNDKIDAAKAYNEKALELFGEFAKLNIIEDNI
jgi:hypothetical protein